MAVNIFYSIIILILGFIIGRLSNIKRVIGDIRVDNSDPEDAPYLFAELKTGIDKLKHGDIVSFKVRTQNYISHD